MIDSPENVLRYFDEKAENVSEQDLFNKPENSWLLDIWVAGKFGSLFNKFIQQCKVEIDEGDSQDYYDFKLHLGNDVVPFQATESLETERRRGKEYKQGESVFDQSYWKESSVEPYEYIAKTIDNKLHRYGKGASDINLVVHVNLFGFKEKYEDVYQHCKASIEQFKSVWLFSTYIFGALYERDEKYYRKNDWIKLQS